ncbi:MAG TPA: O-antigen ligase family protein [Firmicutes bacterium]|nr:O-antigen ligase family protein [Bacillota bacterium]
MSKQAGRRQDIWACLFLFSFCLVLLRPGDPLNFLLFLPGYFFPLRYTGKIRPLYLWLGWAFFSALLAPEFPPSLHVFGQECMIATTGFYAGLYGRQDRRWVWGLILVGFLMAGLIFIQAAMAPPYPLSWAHPAERLLLPFRVTGLWKNPNRTGLFLALLLPLLGAVLEETDGHWRRLLLPGVLFALAVPALLFTYSRTAWTAALASLVFYWGRREKGNLRRLFCLVLLLIGFFPSLVARLGPNPFQSATLRYRFLIWQETWALVQKYPLTGGGGSELRLALRSLRADHAHNHYLQLAAEKGLPVLLLFTGLVFRILRIPFRPKGPREDCCLQRGMQGALVGQLVAGLTESLWVVPLDLFLFWFGFAFITAEEKPVTIEQPGGTTDEGDAGSEGRFL